jgi:hypothetical protein
MTKMDILKGPSKAVLDGSIFNKIILVFCEQGGLSAFEVYWPTT